MCESARSMSCRHGLLEVNETLKQSRNALRCELVDHRLICNVHLIVTL